MTVQEFIDVVSGGDPDAELRLLVPSGHLLPIQHEVAFSFEVWADGVAEPAEQGPGVYLVAGDDKPLLKPVLDELFATGNAVVVGG